MLHVTVLPNIGQSKRILNVQVSDTTMLRQEAGLATKKSPSCQLPCSIDKFLRLVLKILSTSLPCLLKGFPGLHCSP
jgi:hypothetical protein